MMIFSARLKLKKHLPLMAAAAALFILAASLARPLPVSAAPSDYTGKVIAVSGDSISSFYGVIPPSYDFSYPANDIDPISPAYVDQMWWQQVIKNTGAVRGTIAASNNTTVAGNSLDMISKVGCGIRRLVDLQASGQRPDVIFVYLGANDLLQNIPLGSYYPGKPAPAEGIVNNFADAYNMMLIKYRVFYPNAQIICLTCPELVSFQDYGSKTGPTKKVNALGLSINDYNRIIRQVAAGNGCKLIDTYYCGLNVQNAGAFTREGIHPNILGHNLFAYYVLMNL
ncbi:MAG: SGNH/GDSL hydrolase family protein [Lachnospiraceae bacterium]|nr:SGNH/GDSL hydrolase family protein [Lachnospiraceae bacterium]